MLKKRVAMPYYEIVSTPKMYKGILTQTGTAAPTVGIIKNDLTNVVWTRVNVGLYEITWNGSAGTINTIVIQSSGNTPTAIQTYTAIGNPVIQVRVTDLAGNGIDDVLDWSTIEIIAYPIIF